MTLAWVYTHHREELIAELRSTYGVELEEDDEIASSTLDRLWVYYNQLPPLNRISRAALDIDTSEQIWSCDTAVTADLVDAVNYNTYVLHQANSKQKVKPPKPYPRPDYLQKHRQKQDKTLKRDRLPGTVK